MKNTWIVLLFLVSALESLPQERKLTLEGELLFHSRHLWRGMQFGETATAEPSVTIRRGAFSFNVWAAKTRDDSYAEIDLIPSCKINQFEITVLDYYNPIPGEDNTFFNLKDGRNRHSTELALTHHPSAKLPVRMMAATFFFGDKNPNNGHAYYSTYTELGCPVNMAGFQLEPILGLTPHQGYYAGKFAVINTSLQVKRNFIISPALTLPVKFSLVHNPHREKTFVALSAGIGWQ